MSKEEDRTETMRDMVRLLRNFGPRTPALSDPGAEGYFCELAEEIARIEEKHGYEHMCVKFCAAFYEVMETDAHKKHLEKAR